MLSRIAVLILFIFAFPSFAQTPLNPGQDLRAAVQAAAPGSTIILNTGTFSVPGQIRIDKAITIRNNDGAAPILQFPANEVVPFDIKSSNVTLQGFRIANGAWGVYAGDAAIPYSNIVIRNVTVTNATTDHGIFALNTTGIVIENSRVDFAKVNGILVQDGSGAIIRGNTVTTTGAPDAAIKVERNPSAYVSGNTVTNTGSGAHGILLTASTDVVVDGNTVTNAHSNGINARLGSHRAVIINNTVTMTTALHGIAMENSNDVLVAGNTVGAFQFGIILRGVVNGRVERNNVTGALQDGIVVTDAELTRSQHVYVGRNNVVSQGRATGKTDGTGIWLNNETTGTLVYGNSTSGAPENGLTVFNSSNDHFWGNTTTNNGEGGVFIHGPNGLSYSAGNDPVNIIIQGNYAYDLPFNAGVNLHETNSNTVFNNFTRNTPGGIWLQQTGGNRLFLNMARTVVHGLNACPTPTPLASGAPCPYTNAPTNTYFLNRHLASTPNIQNILPTGSGVQPDGGATFGGNFQATTAITGDRYPFSTETLDKAGSVTVTFPATGAVVAQGTRKTVEWRSTGCTYVDISYNSAGTGTQSIVTNYPDVGVYHWNVPAGLAPGSNYTIVLECKVLAGTSLATGTSGAFTVAPSGLELLSPQLNHPVTGGQTTLVSWKRSGAATGPVRVLFRSSPTATPVPLASDVADNEHVVTVPAGATSQSSFIIEHQTSSASDATDGFVNMRGTAAATAPAGTLGIGTLQLLHWVSPAASNYVDIEYLDGSTYRSLATNVPDFGRFYFLVPDSTLTNSNIRVTFKSTTSTVISNVVTGTFNTAAAGSGGGGGNGGGGGTPPPPPVDVVSLLPLSGSGNTVTATAVYRNQTGQSGHYLAIMLFLPLPNIVSFNAQGTCLIEFNRLGGAFDGRGGVRLIDNAGTGWLGRLEGEPARPGTPPLSNNACTVNVAGVTVSYSGNDMTVTYPVTFTNPAVLSATMGTFIQSNSATGQWTDFRQFGNWTIPGAPLRPGPQVLGGTPTTGAGSSGTFTITAGHTAGLSQLGELHIRFAPTIVGSTACHIIYSPAANLMTMINDAGTGLLAHVPLGQPLTTGRCSVPAGPSRVVSGNNFTLTMPVNFNATAFGAGVKNVYVNGFDITGAVTHWIQTGTWTVQ